MIDPTGPRRPVHAVIDPTGNREMREPRVCAVIPAYNEEKHVADVVRALVEGGVEVLVVDDCSGDRTSERAVEAGARVVRHEDNCGKGAALATGLGWARDNGFDAVVTLDGDGQHDPAEIPKFLDAARRGADIAVGTRRFSARRSRLQGVRTRAREMPPVRKFINWGMTYILSFMAGQRLTDTQSGYRLIRTDAWKRLGLSSSRFDAESEMLVRACRSKMRVCEVSIRTIYGDEKSSIRPVRDTLRWLRLIWRLFRTRDRKASGPQACGELSRAVGSVSRCGRRGEMS